MRAKGRFGVVLGRQMAGQGPGTGSIVSPNRLCASDSSAIGEARSSRTIRHATAISYLEDESISDLLVMPHCRRSGSMLTSQLEAGNCSACWRDRWYTPAVGLSRRQYSSEVPQARRAADVER